ncbi:DUF4145 domain-containing protein [Sphingobacterium hungaricum]|uniref:DUF4145 domain-containing protein n=1 Tax=Sphingobacterium hungaricum TaxID=2082723 RepID=A0A928UZJ4_9SPHI|nr:DUF4145 domain-containing protein [Sphingobacterium hungaricum]MBE8714963.1 hypothetical protein [Sphingobacterium hungaricum]
MSVSKDYCPNCRQITNHKCLFNIKTSSDPQSAFEFEHNYETIQCLGCEIIQFRIRYNDESMIRYDDYGYTEVYDEIKYYPKKLSNHFLINNIYDLPDKIRIIYIETIESLTNNCYLLAGVGLRTIIEAVCIDQKITGRTLENKINNLVKNKLITEKDGQRLHSIRFLGNDSVHDMDVPNENKLKTALEVIENLLKSLYLIDIELDQHLDTIIVKFEDFKNLIFRKVNSNLIIVGEEKNLVEILGKDMRRIERSYLTNFVSQLTEEIENNIIKSLSIGKIENNQQYFIKR